MHVASYTHTLTVTAHYLDQFRVITLLVCGPIHYQLHIDCTVDIVL